MSAIAKKKGGLAAFAAKKKAETATTEAELLVKGNTNITVEDVMGLRAPCAGECLTF